MTYPPSPTPRRMRPILVGCAVLGVALITALLLIRPDDQAPQPAAAAATPSATPTTLTVQGGLKLGLGDFIWDEIGTVGQPGPLCAGSGGYKDIAIGAPVSVTDAAGTVVALGEISDSIPKGFSEAETPTSCELRFSVGKVPAGKGFYGVEVSHRGAVKFDEASLAEPVVLTLG